MYREVVSDPARASDRPIYIYIYRGLSEVRVLAEINPRSLPIFNKERTGKCRSDHLSKNMLKHATQLWTMDYDLHNGIVATLLKSDTAANKRGPCKCWIKLPAIHLKKYRGLFIRKSDKNNVRQNLHQK